MPREWRLGPSDSRFIAAVVIVTTLCVGVYLLPAETQDLLKVRHSVFNPFAYLTASFVHGNIMHLTFNLAFFWLFGFLLFFINRTIEKQRFFLYSLLIVFTALPLVNYSLLFYFGIYKSVEFGFGLSLVDSGLIGLTVPSLNMYFRAKLDRFNSTLFLTSMSLLTFFLVLLPYIASLQSSLLAFAILVLSFLSGVSVFKKILGFLWRSLRRKETVAESYFLFLSILFYFASITSLFPTAVLSEGGITDIVSHYIGLLFGIIPFSLLFPVLQYFRHFPQKASKNVDCAVGLLKCRSIGVVGNIPPYIVPQSLSCHLFIFLVLG
jgi:hypothetical protein